MSEHTQTSVPLWKTVLAMIMNPGEVIKNQMAHVPWTFSVIVSGLAFMIFFLQTGLDLFRSGNAGVGTVVLITILGLLYGTAGIAFLASIAWIFSQAGQRDISLKWAISTFALGYSATLVYALLGLLFSLTLGWRTSIAFGVTGVLWALRPNMTTIKQMSGDRTAFSIALTTLCGVILLLGWALLGRFEI